MPIKNSRSCEPVDGDPTDESGRGAEQNPAIGRRPRNPNPLIRPPSPLSHPTEAGRERRRRRQAPAAAEEGNGAGELLSPDSRAASARARLRRAVLAGVLRDTAASARASQRRLRRRVAKSGTAASPNGDKRTREARPPAGAADCQAARARGRAHLQALEVAPAPPWPATATRPFRWASAAPWYFDYDKGSQEIGDLTWTRVSDLGVNFRVYDNWFNPLFSSA
jgi:hypothetical protein